MYDVFDRKAKDLPWKAFRGGEIVEVDNIEDVALFTHCDYNLAVRFSETQGFSRDSVSEIFAPKEKEVTGALGEGYAMDENQNVSGSSYTANYFGGIFYVLIVEELVGYSLL